MQKQGSPNCCFKNKSCLYKQVTNVAPHVWQASILLCSLDLCWWSCWPRHVLRSWTGLSCLRTAKIKMFSGKGCGSFPSLCLVRVPPLWCVKSPPCFFQTMLSLVLRLCKLLSLDPRGSLFYPALWVEGQSSLNNKKHVTLLMLWWDTVWLNQVTSQHALVSHQKDKDRNNKLTFLNSTVALKAQEKPDIKLQETCKFTRVQPSLLAPSTGTNTESNLDLKSPGGQHVYKKGLTTGNTVESNKHWNPAVTLTGLLSKQQQ